ncbi:haloalkane dehalogenase [Tistrella mobilis]|uniref:haloalkane dehalogenase n=1 Tax=Tistrella mobilis TaxID=171437 RepID=UPI0035580F2A
MTQILRTPDARFLDLPGWSYVPHYADDLPGYEGIRIAWIDEPAAVADAGADAPTFLCLHGQPSWSYLYRRMIPQLVARGRVVAPDLIGFGRSDKLTDDRAYGFLFHRGMLVELIKRLDLDNVILVVQDWGGLLGLTLPPEMPERFQGLLVMNTALGTGDRPLGKGFEAWRDFVAKSPDFSISKLFQRGCPHLTPEEAAAYDAPYPDDSYRAGARVFPSLVPDHPDAEGAPLSRAARDWWRSDWSGRSSMVIGMADPVLGKAAMTSLHQVIRGCPPPIEVEDGGHFVQEWADAFMPQALDPLLPPK